MDVPKLSDIKIMETLLNKLPSGCFIPGVMDLTKSSGVMYTSLPPSGVTIFNVAK